MKLQGELTINGKHYVKGDEIAWYKLYPVFFLHMGVFGLSGFWMAYSDNPAPIFFLYLHGGFACLVYTIFYFTIFGRDSVKWMFINAGLGLFGIYSQIDWLLAAFGRSAADYSWAVHVIPFVYYILYTFLLHQAVLDIANSRDNEARKQLVEQVYVLGLLLIYGLFWVLG